MENIDQDQRQKSYYDASICLRVCEKRQFAEIYKTQTSRKM